MSEPDLKFDFGKKKKVKPKVAIVGTCESEPTEGKFVPYDYDFLLKRLMSNVNPVEKAPIVFKAPILFPSGTKKTNWANFREVCNVLQRDITHVKGFIESELNMECSMLGDATSLSIKGKCTSSQMETVLRKYIADYVKCHSCRGVATRLEREARLTFLVCDGCGSKRTVK